MTAKTVHALLDDISFLGEEQYAVVMAVRQVVKKTISPLSEEVKYGGILFSSDVSFGGVFAYKQHVSVEFSKGAQMDDPFGHLEGGGKMRRHLKLTCVDDLKTKHLSEYLPLALEVAMNA